MNKGPDFAGFLYITGKDERAVIRVDGIRLRVRTKDVGNGPLGKRVLFEVTSPHKGGVPRNLTFEEIPAYEDDGLEILEILEE